MCNDDEFENEIISEFDKTSIQLKGLKPFIPGLPRLTDFLNDPTNIELRELSDKEVSEISCDFADFNLSVFDTVPYKLDGINFGIDSPTLCVIKRVLSIPEYIEGWYGLGAVLFYETLFENAATIRSFLKIPGENFGKCEKLTLLDWCYEFTSLPICSRGIVTLANERKNLPPEIVGAPDGWDFSDKNDALKQNLSSFRFTGELANKNDLLSRVSAVFLNIITCLIEFYRFNDDNPSRGKLNNLFYGTDCRRLVDESSYYIGFLRALSGMPSLPKKKTREMKVELMKDVAKAHNGCYNSELSKKYPGKKVIIDARLIENLQDVWDEKFGKHAEKYLGFKINESNARNYIKSFKNLDDLEQINFIENSV